MRKLFGVLVGVTSAVQIVGVVTSDFSGSDPRLALFIATAILAVAVHTVVGRVTVVSLVALSALGIWSIAVTTAANGGSALNSAGLPLFVVATVFGLAAISYKVGRYAAVAAVMIPGVVGVMGYREGVEGAWRAVDAMVLIVGVSGCLALLLRALMAAARQADLSDEAASRITKVQGAGREHERQAQQLERLLHDDVIAALVTIDLVGAVDPDGVKTVAEQALTAMATHTLPAPRAHEAWPTAGLPHVTLALDPAFREEGWPEAVIDAMSAAATEALRNVHRHSGVDEATLHIACRGEVLEVRVSDRGRGIEPGVHEGFGMASSIRGRLLDLGGTVHVVSAPRRGTTIVLRWSRHAGTVPVLVGAYRSIDLAVAGVARIATWPVASLVVANSWLAARYLDASARPYLAGLVLLGVLVLSLVATRRGVTRPLSAASVASILVGVYGLLAVGLYAAGSGRLLDYGSWVVNMAAIPLLVLALVGTVRLMFAATAGYSMIVWMVAVIDPLISPWDALSPMLVAPGQIGVVGVMVAAIRRLGRTTDRNAAHVAVAAVAASRERSQIGLIEERLEQVRRAVTPLLDAVVQDPSRLVDAETRRRAKVLAAAVRDELVAPALLDTELREILRAARVRGVEVHLRLTDVSEAGTALRAQLIDLLPRLHDQAVVVASDHASDRMAGRDVVVVVTRPDGESSRLVIRGDQRANSPGTEPASA